MAKVTFQTAAHQLRKEQQAMAFWAKSNKGGAIGFLAISSGGLRWYPGRRNKKHFFLSWEQLDKSLPKVTKLRG